jgi:myosin-1
MSAGMLVDNRDLLSNDVQKLMASTASSFPLLADMFKDTRSKEERAKRPPTAGQQFRQSVAQLIEVLSECQPHYVRTIKPNDQKKVRRRGRDGECRVGGGQ